VEGNQLLTLLPYFINFTVEYLDWKPEIYLALVRMRNNSYYEPQMDQVAFYRINDIVIVPADAVITIIEVKTSIDARRFHEVLDYFKEVKNICFKPAYLFIYNAPKLGQLYGYFESYAAENGPYTYDHDTAQLLPDEITGIQTSYHITQDLVVGDGSDTFGYSAWSFKDEADKEISALQNFYLSVYERVENYISDTMKLKLPTPRKDYYTRRFQDYRAFSLFEL
jgi:hypothetical protein